MPLIYRFRFTDDFLITALLNYRLQQGWRRPFMRFRWWWAVALAGLFALCVANHLRVPALVAAALLGPLVLGWPIERAIIRWRFRRSPFRNDDVEATLSDEGLFTRGRGSEVRVEWPAITRAHRLPDGWLLYQGPDICNWLPDSAAVEPATPAAAEELIRRHVEDCRRE